MIFERRDDLTKFLVTNAKAYKEALALRTFEASSDLKNRDKVILVADARGDSKEKIYRLLERKIGSDRCRIRRKTNGKILDMKVENWFVDIRQNSYSLLNPKTMDGIENEKLLHKNINILISVLGPIDLRFRDDIGRVWRPGDKNNRVVEAIGIGEKININKKSKVKADVILILESGKRIPVSVKKKNGGRWESADTLFKKEGAEILTKAVRERKIQLEKIGGSYRINGSVGAKTTKAEAELVMFGYDILNEKGGIVMQDFNADSFHIPAKTNEVYIDCKEIIRKLDDTSEENYPYIYFSNRPERVTMSEFPGIRIEAVPRKKLGPNAILLSR